MNTNFKPLSLAAAVATATAGYAGVTNAQSVAAETQLGDLAIVPYYTVMEGYATGINIVNTSNRTQAIKFRFRRAADSMDALDFNVVLSPYDMYTGFIGQQGDDIVFTSNDNSCTAPSYNVNGNGFKMPDIYKDGAETGYVEIISMGSPVAETEAVAVSAKHDSTGVPADCAGVQDNFYQNTAGNTAVRGVIDSTQTIQMVKGVATPNTWEDAEDSLKVSYFIKSDETGVEFGNNAVHIAEFMDGPAMTNQQFGVFDGDLLGFDHPDLNGGSPIGNGASIGKYDALRGILGADSLLNDWSTNATGEFSVDTDWVVTIPGQYLMVDLPFFQVGLDLAEAGAISAAEEVCTRSGVTFSGEALPACDFRDIPMTASFTVYDREEQGVTVEEGDLVVSPQPPTDIPTDTLDKEVNVIQWGSAPVLNAPAFIQVPTPDGANFGWVNLTATSFTGGNGQQVCTYVPGTTNPAAAALGYEIPAMTCAAVTTPAPMVGFAAWQRNFANLPAANYGRIVEHSRMKSSS